jgi:hypothetical protein
LPSAEATAFGAQVGGLRIDHGRLGERNALGDAARARELIAAGRAEAETLGMARELVRFERLTERLERP